MVCYQNVRGLRTKLAEFACSVEAMAEKPDVLILTETWLCAGISDTELGLRDYNIYRCDRSVHTSEHSRGGGVLIAVKNNFFSRSIGTTVVNVEQLFVVLNAGFSRLVIGTVYIPPGSGVDVYEAHCRSVFDVWSAYTNLALLLPGTIICRIFRGIMSVVCSVVVW